MPLLHQTPEAASSAASAKADDLIAFATKSFVELEKEALALHHLVFRLALRLKCTVNVRDRTEEEFAFLRGGTKKARPGPVAWLSEKDALRPARTASLLKSNTAVVKRVLEALGEGKVAIGSPSDSAQRNTSQSSSRPTSPRTPRRNVVVRNATSQTVEVGQDYTPTTNPTNPTTPPEAPLLQHEDRQRLHNSVAMLRRNMELHSPPHADDGNRPLSPYRPYHTTSPHSRHFVPVLPTWNDPSPIPPSSLSPTNPLDPTLAAPAPPRRPPLTTPPSQHSPPQ
eukprot:Sspe_Gene.109901::Locus_90140_Transcript_1_1_Confidence_1.000_Length_888::g.109901::m.109901